MTKTIFSRHASKLLAAVLAIGTLVTCGAGAANNVSSVSAPVAYLTTSLTSSIGTALTSSEVTTAEQALAKAKAEAEAKAKAEAEAKAKAEAEAKAKAEELAKYNQLMSSPVARTVAYSSSLMADSTITNNAKALGNYRLSFYCPCAVCNGTTSGLTAAGTTLTEGRTIAVDSSIIPLGSRVFIEGYGVFVAEDTGSAIKGNRIDVLVGSHSRAYDIGIQYANVYLLG